MVATPLAWDEVNAKLDPARFTLRTVPERLARLKQDPWRDFFDVNQRLPNVASAPQRKAARAPAPPVSDSAPRARIVVARKPRKR